MSSSTPSDLPRINRERGKLRLLNVDCLGKPVADKFRWCIGSVLHRNHVPTGSQCRWYVYLWSQNEYHSLDYEVSKLQRAITLGMLKHTYRKVCGRRAHSHPGGIFGLL